MLTLISITAITVAVLFPLYFKLRNGALSLPAALACAVLLAAFLEFFDLLTLCNPEQLNVWKKFSLTTEAILLPAWLIYAMTAGRQSVTYKALPAHVRFLLAASPLLLIAAVALPTHSFVYSPDFFTEKILFLSNSGFAFFLVILVYLVAALIQLERTLAHTTLTSRWKIKLELLGAGAYLSALLIYYSQGLLFRTINMQLVPMRSAVLIVSVVIIFYSRLKRGSGVTVHVSPQFAYKSVVLLAVGIYIICLGLVGEGLKYFGNGFQHAMIITLAIFVGLGLFIVILSESVKRKVRIFIQKNFYQHKYDYRNQWLQFTDRLSAAQTSDSLLHSIVSEFCDTFGMGKGALFIISQERDVYRQAADIALETCDVTFTINDPIIESLTGCKWILDLRDNVAICPESDRHKTYFSEAAACFIIPLFMNGSVDGFIVLGMPRSSDENYIHEDFDLMRTLAKQAASALLNLRLSDQLTCSRELAAVGKVSTFVMHDLKNLIAALSLMLENAQEHIGLPAFQSDLLVSLKNIVTRMNALILRLKQLPEKNSLHLATVDLFQMAHETAALVNGALLNVTGDHVIAEADREELQKVALNLMLNAVEATNGTKPVKVEVGENGSLFFRVTDEGCGIAEAFVQHTLFKPFTSTKEQGMGIGLYQSRQIIEAHGGRIEVVSTIGQGSEFTVWLPRIQAEAA